MDADLDPRVNEARETLQGQLPEDLPVDFEAMFPKLVGWGVARANSKRMDLLERLAPVLRPALEPDERLVFVTQGTVNLAWEQMMMGLWANLLNRTGMVLTNERLLLVHLHGKVPIMYVNQVRRSAIKSAGGILGTVVKLGRGRIILSGVKGADRKIFRNLLGKNKQAVGGKEHLCPICYAVQDKYVKQCKSCNESFKSPLAAAFRSFLFPGLGDFYLGHRGFAVLEMLGSLLVWAGLLTAAFGGVEEGLGLEAAICFAPVLLAYNSFDAALTHAQARKGLQALDGKLGTREVGAGRLQG